MRSMCILLVLVLGALLIPSLHPGRAADPSLQSMAALDDGYWRSSPYLSLDWEAACDAGLRNITFLMRHSADNVTFDPWIVAGVIEMNGENNASSIEHGQFSIILSEEGYYQFLTVAASVNGAEEEIQGADCFVGLDLTPPSSAMTQGAYYVTVGQITLEIEASEALSGVEEMQVWARSSTDNITWSSWRIVMSHAYDRAYVPLMDGFYQLHVRATEIAGNIELAKPTEASYCMDTLPPNCTAHALSSWSTEREVWFNISLQDATSGLKEMEVWLAESADNRTWKNWTVVHTGLTDGFSYTAPRDAYFGLSARGFDRAGNLATTQEVSPSHLHTRSTMM